MSSFMLYSFLHVPEKTNITKNTKINNEQILGYITIISAQNYIANLDSKINYFLVDLESGEQLEISPAQIAQDYRAKVTMYLQRF